MLLMSMFSRAGHWPAETPTPINGNVKHLYRFPVSATYTVYSVMSGLGPDIHVFRCYELQRRGCRAFARHDGMGRTH